MKNQIACCILICVAGCRGQISEDPPIVPLRNMYLQPRYNPQAESTYFQDGRTMRLPVPGTIPVEAVVDTESATGRAADGTGYVASIPAEVRAKFRDAENMLERGKARYNIYCAPCHSELGDGKGMIVKRGMLPPPSFHDERLRHIPDGQLFATISNGVGNMPAYRHSIPNQDRWAIVGYVRGLQLTQTGLQRVEPKAAGAQPLAKKSSAARDSK